MVVGFGIYWVVVRVVVNLGEEFVMLVVGYMNWEYVVFVESD